MEKVILSVDVDYVDGHLRTGHLELETTKDKIKDLTQEQLKELVKEDGHLVIDDEEVNGYGDIMGDVQVEEHKEKADLIKDDKIFQRKFGFEKAVSNMNNEELLKYLDFRLNVLVAEEFNETLEAFKNKDAEEVVDGLIDITVNVLGTLSLFGVDVGKAWNEVYKSNMSKTSGTKPGRESSNGVDVWKATQEDVDNGKATQVFIPASHKGNHGKLEELFRK